MHTPARSITAGAVMRAAVLSIATLTGLLIVLLRDVLLPERFLHDGITIRAIALGDVQADASYTNVADVYRVLGLADVPVVAHLVGYGLLILAMLLVWRACAEAGGGWGMTVLVALMVVLGAVYLGYYSKDVFVLPIVIAVVLLRGRWWGESLVVLLMLGYALWFRQYWYVVAIGYVAFRLIAPRLRAWSAFATGLLGVIVASLVLGLALGVSPDNFRTIVNDARGSVDVGTLIEPFVALPSPLGGVVNNALTYVSLILPVPVMLRGGAYYLVIALVIAVIWLLFFRGVARAPLTTAGVPFRRSVALILAFVVTQSLFEPDYGSALRHLTPLLPLFLLVVWSTAGGGRGTGLADGREAHAAREKESIR